MLIKKKNIITIGGETSSGKSGTIEFLHKIYPAYEHCSVGEIVRGIAKKANVSIEDLNEYNVKHGLSFDKQVDDMLKRISENENFYLIDSRLGFHFVPNSFKVLLKVDSYVAAERRWADYKKSEPEKYANATVEDVLKDIKKRDQENHDRYMQKYNVDIKDETKYDFVIDTTDKTPVEVCNLIMNAYIDWLKSRYIEVPD